MPKILSLDLRERVVAAIASGLSCRQAAARFGVSAASAVRWTQRSRVEGSLAPKPVGGDRRSARIENHAGFILEAVEQTADLTLAELQAKLKAERTEHFGIGTLWRFFERHRITLKKSRRMLRNKAAMT